MNFENLEGNFNLPKAVESEVGQVKNKLKYYLAKSIKYIIPDFTTADLYKLAVVEDSTLLPGSNNVEFVEGQDQSKQMDKFFENIINGWTSDGLNITFSGQNQLLHEKIYQSCAALLTIILDQDKDGFFSRYKNGEEPKLYKNVHNKLKNQTNNLEIARLLVKTAMGI